MSFTLDQLKTPTIRKASQEGLYRLVDEDVNPSCYDQLGFEFPIFYHRTARGTAV